MRGEAGNGKSTLARAVARKLRAAGKFPCGDIWVELGGADSEEQVYGRFCAALNIMQKVGVAELPFGVATGHTCIIVTAPSFDTTYQPTYNPHTITVPMLQSQPLTAMYATMVGDAKI